MRSIKSKIVTGFIAVILLVLAIGGGNYYFSALSTKQTGVIVNDELPKLLLANKLGMNVLERTSLARGYVTYGQQNFLTSFDYATEESRKLEEELLALDSTVATKDAINLIHQWEEELETDIFTIYRDGDKDRALFNFKDKVEKTGRQIQTTFNVLTDNHAATITENATDIVHGNKQSTYMSAGIAILSIILGLAIALYMANSISKPIIRASKRMKLIAEGDLTHEDLQTKSKDEVGHLIRSLNVLNQEIRSIATEIRTASTTVMNRSEELSHAANEVNSGSQQVALTIEELSKAADIQSTYATELVESMFSLTKNIHNANEYGQKANVVTSDVLYLTHKGNEAMSESIHKINVIDDNVRGAVKKVQSLDSHSKKISQLIQVISDIADQTNLLALNAAIEAARAGEHGKGFAVVAGEVKKLAEQVSSSVTDITGIVSTIQKETSEVVHSLHESFDQVEAGTEQIKETGTIFTSITESIQEVVTQIQTISEDLDKIAISSDTMNDSITNIASVSEEASTKVEETASFAEETTSSMQEIAASSDSLATVSVDMDQLVRRFIV